MRGSRVAAPIVGRMYTTDDTTDDTNVRERLLAGIPVTERRLKLAGVSTAVLEGGDGPPDRPPARPGGVRGQVDAGDPGSRDEQSRRSSRPAGPRRLRGAGRPAGRRPRARVARRADRADLPVAAHATWGTCSAARSRPASPPRSGRSTRQAGAGGHAGARVDFSRRRGSLSPWVGFLARPTEGSYNRFMRQCSFDLDGLREQMGERWDPFVSYNLNLARAPSAKAAGRLMRELGVPQDPAGGSRAIRRADDADLGAARPRKPAADGRGRQRPVRLAAARHRGLRRRPPTRPARSVPGGAAGIGTRRGAGPWPPSACLAIPRWDYLGGGGTRQFTPWLSSPVGKTKASPVPVMWYWTAPAWPLVLPIFF